MTALVSIRIIVLGAALAALMVNSIGCAADPPTITPQPTNAATPGSSGISSPMPTDAASPSPSPGAAGVLLTVATRGGLCPDGPCGTTIVIDRDGRVHLAAKPPNELGTLSPELLAEIDAAIATTDWAELVSHRFIGLCPTAYDGQEVVFEFATADGVQQIASCEVAVDYELPLFAAVAQAVRAFMPLTVE